MILPPPALVSQSRYVPAIAAGPPRLPDRRIMPYVHPNRGFWVDQFASVDVNRQEPLPQDWHPFVDVPPVPQPAVTGGVMAILDYDLKVMAEFVANVSCNFINLHKPWTALTLFVEKGSQSNSFTIQYCNSWNHVPCKTTFVLNHHPTKEIRLLRLFRQHNFTSI